MLNLDWTGIIGLLAIGQTTALLIYLAKQSKANKAMLLPLILFAVILIALTHDVLLHTKLALYFPHILGLGPFHTYLIGPLVLMITIKLLRPDEKLSQMNWLHLIPFIIHMGFEVQGYVRSAADKLQILEGYLASSPQYAVQQFSLNSLYQILSFYGHRFLYFAFAIYLLRNIRIDFNHAVDSRKNFAQLLKMVLISYCLIWGIFKILVYIPWSSIWLVTNVTMLNGIALSLLVIGVSNLCLNNPIAEIFSIKSTQKYKNTNIGEDLNTAVFNEVKAYLNQKEVFTNSEIKLSDVAKSTGHSSINISQAISANGDSTFNQMVNALRVEEVKKLFADRVNDELDIQQIAFKAGFNSKATFNRVFKSFMNMTPTQYRKSLN